MPRIFLLLFFLLSGALFAHQDIQLVSLPKLSPDGSQVVFEWNGDIWIVATEGGEARQLTYHEGLDHNPIFSPDGKTIAFVSWRDGAGQVFTMPSSGGRIQKVAFHTQGYRLQEYFPDGKHILAVANRDFGDYRAKRALKVNIVERRNEEVLFNADCKDATLSADGSKILFTREGVGLYRQGYRGSQAQQIWLYDMESGQYEKILHRESGCRSPMWNSDGSGFFYLSDEQGVFNLKFHDLKSGEEKVLTENSEDAIILPAINSKRNRIVYRRKFDLFTFDVERNFLARVFTSSQEKKVRIWNRLDHSEDAGKERLTLNKANEVVFSKDGLEMAFIAGHDVYVMDTVLREPRRLTETVAVESNLQMSDDGNCIYYISDDGRRSKIVRSRRADEEKFWWLNEEFKQEVLYEDEVEFDLMSLSPGGDSLLFVKKPGDLFSLELKANQAKLLIDSWNPSYYDWSPDGRWIVYSHTDDDYNQDVFIMPIDGSRKPFNLSVHPDWDGMATWSPDGSKIAFVSRRNDSHDLYFAHLTRESSETSNRDRTLRKALEVMNKSRKKKASKKPKDHSAGKVEAKVDTSDKARAVVGKKTEPVSEGVVKDAADSTQEPKPEIKIDFDNLRERVQRINIAGDVREMNFSWSADGKKLAYVVRGKNTALYTVAFPELKKPIKVYEGTADFTSWPKDDKFYGLSKGIPFVLSKGKMKTYPFKVHTEKLRSEANRLAFGLIWRTMRDSFYDVRLNNKDWDAVYEKYVDAAINAPNEIIFRRVVVMVLGELNASHMGFTSSRSAKHSSGWTEVTRHLGLRFDHEFEGPGVKVREVIPGGPADKVKSQIRAGEIVVSIDDVQIDHGFDMTRVMNGLLDEELKLVVENAEGDRRTLFIEATTFSEMSQLISRQQVKARRSEVDRLSDGKLGYLHIASMNWPEFEKFQQEVFAEGVGKDGLVIDVRNNGGGFTTDHLLTVLCQPRHAVCVPRGGGRGYPFRRQVYVNWYKPIIVLCNQNSFSNAEIFSHAIRNLNRGKLVGVRTAGGVISTGSTKILDRGTLRMPFRGWFAISDGEDMELNGAQPNITIWPHAGDMERAVDKQLERAVKELLNDVDVFSKKSLLKLRKASER